MKKHILFLILGISFLDIGQEKGLELAVELSNPAEILFDHIFSAVLSDETNYADIEIALGNK